MRLVAQASRVITYSKLGLMILREHFEQRPIEATYGSFRSLMPLRTPSGPQWTESELETELLEQLAFCPFTYDLLTQPIIRYRLDGKDRRYTPDIVVQLHASGDRMPGRFIIEVKRSAELAQGDEAREIRFQVGRACAEATGAVFRVLDETMIRTPHLANARRLARHVSDPADPEEHEDRAVHGIRTHGPMSVTEAIRRLGREGFAEPDARHAIETAVARRYLHADLSAPFDDATVIGAHVDGFALSANGEAILQALRRAPDR